jgi:hypothetical protein
MTWMNAATEGMDGQTSLVTCFRDRLHRFHDSLTVKVKERGSW